MKPNKVKDLLSRGGVAIGTMVFEFDSTGITRLASASGADFVVIDTEHSGWAGETIRRMLADGAAADLSILVRVPDHRSALGAQALDLGAAGLMAPQMETAAQAAAFASSAIYPPAGTRGAFFGLARDDYRPVPDLTTRMEEANANLLLIALVESATGVDNVDAIAAVDGVDVIWLGQFDLTLSMGIPGEFEHPRFRDAVATVVAACNRWGKAAGFMATTPDDARLALERGFRCIAFSNDVRIYRSGLTDGIAQVRAAASERRDA
jgi:2-keto-3-deoxy-L-rhamnonate aldolase RhmA